MCLAPAAAAPAALTADCCVHSGCFLPVVVGGLRVGDVLLRDRDRTRTPGRRRDGNTELEQVQQ